MFNKLSFVYLRVHPLLIMQTKSVLFLGLLCLVFSCGPSGEPSVESVLKKRLGDTIPMKYARNIVMVRYPDGTKVELKDPWHEGKTLQTYMLKTPLSRSIVFTSAHCHLLYWLRAADAVTGVCDKKYVKATLKAVDCGDGMAPDIEKIVSLHPQALLVSPFENSGGHGLLEKTHIPIIETAEYMEATPLGRAEWMKFYGLLYGREREADSLFHVVDSTYHALCNMVRQTTTRPAILTERKTGSVWYVPGGRSTMAQIIRDAGGTHPFGTDTHSGSLALSPEAVIACAPNVDVWAFKHTSPRPLTSAQLLAEYHGYKAMKAFQTKNIFQCNTLQRPYFEESSFRPDLLLREFIIILHPELHLGSLRYYEPTK